MFDFDNLKEYGKPYIIAEAGANHNGDLQLAFKLIEKAKEKGADCIKFQSWTKETVFSKVVYENNYFLQDDYRKRTDYTLESIVDAYSINEKEHYQLAEYCKKVGIDFNSTPFSKKEVDMLVDGLKVPFIKVASMDLNNHSLLKYIAQKGKPVVISTGLCGLNEVYEAVECLENNGCSQIVLLHCISIYPPDNTQVNLNNIDTLRTVLGHKVGYSDHTLGTIAPIMSLAKGVCIIEKHFTLDKNMDGWDHKISANPEELGLIVEAAQFGYQMLGTKEKKVVENVERRNAFQRSIVAARDIVKGDIIKENDLDFKRPGSGLAPKYYEFLIGKEAKRNIAYDEIIQMEDF